ncbi:MAG: primosomal protein N' [Actinobacteria bacterium]|nr:primosomal protein N' [Actinomycetota bacterium]
MRSGQKYAEVYIDIRSLGADHHFDYSIPYGMESRLEIGNVVLVPVKSRSEIGYIVGIKDFTELDPAVVKPISSIVDIPPLFDNGRIELARWMSSYYIQPLTSVLRLFLPPGKKTRASLEGRVIGFKYEAIVKLSGAYGGGRAEIEDRTGIPGGPPVKRTGAQKRIIEHLIMAGKDGMRRADLLAAAGTSAGPLKRLKEKNIIEIHMERVRRDFKYATGRGQSADRVGFELNQYQKKVTEAVLSVLEEGGRQKFLIQGVTGSGKTETYMEMCGRALDLGRKALILVPEISLTSQLFERFEKRFSRRVAVYHSHMSDAERYERWMEIFEGGVDLIIGTRSALFTPVADLGIIIMDEEHDPSYKEGSQVRYNTQDVAIKLSEIKNIPVVFGSATPSISTRYRAEKENGFTLLKIPVRAAAADNVERKVVDLKAIDRKKEDEFITSALFMAMREELGKDNKVILFINRRGFSNFVVCTACGDVPKCPACDLSYNYHRDVGRLICHHCGREEIYSGKCISCGTGTLFLAGSGVQRVEARIRSRFPGIPVYRMDSDITTKKKSHQEIISDFSAPGRSILVGTQMIAKGLDIADVTLVGVINSDGMLSLPDYHMNERAYQLITQVSGRAGRKDKKGRVIIQTYKPDSGVIRHLLDEDYEKFYAEELESRKELSYPPFSNLVNIVISGLEEAPVIAESKKLFDKIYKDIKMDIKILGPAPAPFYRINRFYRRHILVKSENIDKLTAELGKILKKYKKSRDIRIIVDVDPAWIL